MSTKAVLTIGGRDFLLKPSLSHSQMSDLLIMLEGLTEVNRRWFERSSDCKTVKENEETLVALSLIPPGRIITRAEWEALLAAEKAEVKP